MTEFEEHSPNTAVQPEQGIVPASCAQCARYNPGSLKDEYVRLVLEGERVIAEERLLTDLNSRIRAVNEGPDGALYVLTDGNLKPVDKGVDWDDGGKILRLVPKK